MLEIEVAPKEQIKFKKEDVLVPLAKEYEQDKQGAAESLDCLISDAILSKSFIQESFMKCIDNMDKGIIGAAHGGEHLVRVVRLAGEIVADQEKKGVVFPIWLKMAIGCATIAHDSGAIPEEDQAQEEVYEGHERKSAMIAQSVAGGMDDRDFKAPISPDDIPKIEIDREAFEEVVSVMVMATSASINLSFDSRENETREKTRAGLPIFSMVDKIKAGNAESLREAQTEDEKLLADSLLRLSEKFKSEDLFWDQLTVGMGVMAAADYGSYQTRQAIIQEKMALFLGFHQVWETEKGKLVHRPTLTRTAEEFAFKPAFANAVEKTYSDFFTPKMQAAAKRNKVIFARINELVSEGFDPCLRVEGGILPRELLKVAKKLGVDKDTLFIDSLVDFSNQLMAVTKKKPEGFGPMATPVIAAMVGALGEERSLEVFSALFTEMVEDMNANKRNKDEIRVQIAPGAYGGAKVLNNIISAAEAGGIPNLFLTLRQNIAKDVLLENLAQVALQVSGNDKLGVALAGPMNPEVLDSVLTLFDAAFLINPNGFDLDKIFIHLGVSEEGQIVYRQLDKSFQAITAFVKSRGVNDPSEKLWLHLDDNFASFKQWAIDHQEEWQILKDKVQLSISPYPKIIYSDDHFYMIFGSLEIGLKVRKTRQDNQCLFLLQLIMFIPEQLALRLRDLCLRLIN